MKYISVLINRYGGNMLEAHLGDRASREQLLGKGIRQALRDMEEDAVSGEAHLDLKVGNGSVKYISGRQFGPEVHHSDEFKIVDVMMPDYHSDYLMVLGTEEMIAEAVIFCPAGIQPMDFIRKNAEKNGLNITASGKGWANVLDHDGKNHLWNYIRL